MPAAFNNSKTVAGAAAAAKGMNENHVSGHGRPKVAGTNNNVKIISQIKDMNLKTKTNTSRTEIAELGKIRSSLIESNQTTVTAQVGNDDTHKYVKKSGKDSNPAVHLVDPEAESKKKNNKFWRNVGSVLSMRILAGVDAALWVAPIVNTENRAYNGMQSMVYSSIAISVCILSGLLAILLSDHLSRRAIEDGGYWNVKRISSIVCGCLLMLYSLKLYLDGDGDDDSDLDEQWKIREIVDVVGYDIHDTADMHAHMVHDHARQSMMPSMSKLFTRPTQARTHTCTTKSAKPLSYLTDKLSESMEQMEREEEEILFVEVKENKELIPMKRYLGPWSFAIIAFLGVTDDALISMCVLIGGDVSFAELVVGVTGGTIFILLSCFTLGYVHCFIEVMEKIPFWSLVAGIGGW
eukprot:CAMPEP_0197518434 /NCGR_PEP_ID=MMETSP1318-20131121/3637_1 /TAXON_ID=552666 /ORGANISM="Partenskyella glossopodia, Strain RCC365" /LENGTH=407 /DNA_ID=CAMNT_0043068781 /DNA_START=318 /DNA_END=1537 /DNA_ORIENTATION=-